MIDPVDKAVAELLSEPPEMSEAAYTAGLTRVQAASSGVVALAPARTISRRRFLPLAAAAAALAAAGTGVFVASRGGGEPAAPATFTDPVLGPDQRFYLRVEDQAVSIASKEVTEYWIPAVWDQDWHSHIQITPNGVPGGSDLIAPGGQFGDGGGTAGGTKVGPTEARRLVTVLPRDLDGLRRHFAAIPEPDRPILLTDVLAAPAPAELRAPLVQLLREQPGMRVTENTHSIDGRPATEFTYEHAASADPRDRASRTTTYLSPGDGRVIGSVHSLLNPDQVFTRVTYTYAVVNGIGTRP
ncbi:hypothetical protein [Amycolatopsis sp. NPDC059657]|uniref:hypothetical protein n=1 Tax=Amycolatopsis sp. NPDC059657 TaxID=3346899 RepID=UPI003670F8CF